MLFFISCEFCPLMIFTAEEESTRRTEEAMNIHKNALQKIRNISGAYRPVFSEKQNERLQY